MQQRCSHRHGRTVSLDLVDLSRQIGPASARAPVPSGLGEHGILSPSFRGSRINYFAPWLPALPSSPVRPRNNPKPAVMQRSARTTVKFRTAPLPLQPPSESPDRLQPGLRHALRFWDACSRQEVDVVQVEGGGQPGACMAQGAGCLHACLRALGKSRSSLLTRLFCPSVDLGRSLATLPVPSAWFAAAQEA